MTMSTAYGEWYDAESIAIIHRAIDKRLNFQDTPEANEDGVNEE